jgi:hypothetical protein
MGVFVLVEKFYVYGLGKETFWLLTNAMKLKVCVISKIIDYSEILGVNT